MASVCIVWLPDSRVIGPFPDGESAVLWIETLPNALVEDVHDLDHAFVNGDFHLNHLEPMREASTSAPGEVLAYDLPWAQHVARFIDEQGGGS